MVAPFRRDIDVAVARAFLTVVESGSVTAAARALNLTQGAVSQQIKRLEDLLAATLFDRRPRRLALTPAGERLLATARRLVAANDELWATMRAPAFEGEVKLGVPYDIIGSHLPHVLRRFGMTMPRVRVTLVCKDTLVLREELKSGAIDVALTTELDCGRFGETLVTDRLVWVGARGGDAHEKDPLPVSLGAPTCVFRPVAIEALAQVGRDWRPVCEISNMEPVRATIEAGLAVAPLLRRSVPDKLDVLGPASGLPPLPEFRINLYAPRRAGPIAQALADHVRNCVGGSGGTAAV
ncbi:MAG: LysR family transcriptional regulator [Alphaproteobacteria bacterium]|nr:LysR family transcriptional regulator [Alphaproteobacteria bacterium]